MSAPSPRVAALAGVAVQLRDEPALLASLGHRSATLAVPEPARAPLLAGIAAASQRSPLVVLVPTGSEAIRLCEDLAAFFADDEVELFPAWETLPFERVSPSVETMGQRMRVMWRLQSDDAPKVIVAPARSMVQRLGPHVDEAHPITVSVRSTLDQTEFVTDLVNMGYRREYQVEHRGEIAVRGSIVDVFAPTSDAPVRIDFWGDDVERLTTFSVADQRSEVEIDSIDLFACRELMCTPEVVARAEELLRSAPWGAQNWQRLADGELFDGMESWLAWLCETDHILLDLIGANAQIVVVEPRRVRDRAREIIEEELDLTRSLAVTWGVDPESVHPRMFVDFESLLDHTQAPSWTMTTLPEGPEVALVEAAGWHSVGGDGTRLVGQLRDLLTREYRVVVCADGEGSANRLHSLLLEHGLDFKVVEPQSPTLLRPGGAIVVAPLHRGCILPTSKLALLAESDVTGRRRSHRPPRQRSKKAAAFFDDLTVGSYVVHHHHGVARFGGMVKRTIGGSERDYLQLDYRGDDRLYVPSDQIDAVRPYSGGETPTLSKMGGSDFARTKAKVRSEVNEIAQELVVLYQRRVNSQGRAFTSDTPWQTEMEQNFAFQETPDQLSAINDVKADMEQVRPMDRLVVGDVGFGKTEIAVRAAFKAVQDGCQVAVLVPTTLLAQQHLQTFSDRFASYPIRVEMLSRFLTNAEARRVIDGLADGSVDVVIGTHRLLSQGVLFKNLGLLVVDEEQRFGVSHKEAIKHLKANVDVLTLTATPIPRTLEMSLTGIRDMSLLQTPPASRQPILTYVGEYDERAVSEALRRELLREGQVFFVHNRVADIERTAEQLRELVPEARIAVAHGQMDESALEQVVIDFWEQRYDVLVCTTIIESGIDIPTVNTLVVERADLLGLGQLHQLRGRVGRSGTRAYAYLFFPPDRELTEEAYERLRTIGESTELGSGFRIAMRDLEIRGAGNLLGTGQSGQMAAVGYDLYCQMVTEAIGELNGETPREPAEIKIELPIDASLPAEYIERDDLRLDAYRRLAVVTGVGDVLDIEAEWVDRFGQIPEPAARLLAIARLRAHCVRTGATEISVGKSTAFVGPPLVARISPVKLAQSKQMRLERLFPKSVYKADLGQVQLPVQAGMAMVATIEQFFSECLPVVEQ